MKITREQVEHVAMLARLELTEAQIEEYTKQLDSILEYAEILEQLDTQEVVPTAHVMEITNVMRADLVQPSMTQDEILVNAPEAADGFFKVPKIV